MKDYLLLVPLQIISKKKNDGACFDGEVPGTKKFTCNCAFPFAGERCEINLCDGKECLNGGACVEDKSDGATRSKCDCPDGTTGDRCQTISCGKNIPCHNGGTCNGEICQCSQENGIAKYHGQSCDMPAACDGNPCQNGGSCTGKIQINNTQDCFKVNFEHFIQSYTV